MAEMPIRFRWRADRPRLAVVGTQVIHGEDDLALCIFDEPPMNLMKITVLKLSQ